MHKTHPKKALVVFSGGQDSTTCLYWAKQHFDEVHTLTIDYGQRHSIELEAAQKIAAMAHVASHELLTIGSILDGRSPLTNAAEELETYNSNAEMEAIVQDRIELTFVPIRNALFLTVAANKAICKDIRTIVTGVCQADNANYPDCRQDFIEAQELTINRALGITDFKIATPLLHLAKPEGIRLAMTLPGCMEAMAYTHTAYDGIYPPTGKDHASVLRAWGFEQAGVPDPLVVRAWRERLMDLPRTKNYDSLR